MLENQDRRAFVTISVDDGHPTDLRTAELLRKYELPATFYVLAQNPERPVLSRQQLQGLGAEFELGAHTMNHVHLTSAGANTARREITDSKSWLEDLIGARIVSFCYPGGKHNACVVKLVMNAGFRGARTCLLNRHDLPTNPFIWGASTQAHAHSRFVQIRHGVLEYNFRGLANYFRIYKGATDWASHFKRAVELVRNEGGIAHLYLHSWEVEANDDWDRLESVLRLVGHLTNVNKVTNGELFELWYETNQSMVPNTP